MINNDSVYICASSDLKIDVAVLESWIREWGCDACDTIDAYTVDCYPQERVIEDHRRKNNSKVFLFLLDSDVGPKIWKHACADARAAKDLLKPIVVIRHDAQPGDSWISCPRELQGVSGFEVGFDRDSIHRILTQLRDNKRLKQSDLDTLGGGVLT